MGIRAPITLVFAAGLALAGLACFDSDDLTGAGESSTSGGGETVTPYSDESEDSGDPNWTAEETGPAEIDCEDAIDCLITCQAELIFNPMDEPDLSCFPNCAMGLNTEEAYKLLNLAECITNVCIDNGDCGADATDQDCLMCIAAYGTDPQPPGCLEEAAACYGD